MPGEPGGSGDQDPEPRAIRADSADTFIADSSAISPDEVDWYSKAREIVLRRLSVRARSREELRVSLAERGVPENYQLEVLARFGELGLVDDAAFAAAFVDSQLRALHGSRAIAHKLRARGVGQELIDAALAEVDEAMETELATSLVAQRWARLSGLEESVRVRRLNGLLARRGFTGQVARKAISAVAERSGHASVPGSPITD